MAPLTASQVLEALALGEDAPSTEDIPDQTLPDPKALQEAGEAIQALQAS